MGTAVRAVVFPDRQALMRLVGLLWLLFVTAISMMPLKYKYRAGTTGVFHTPGHLVIFVVTALLLCWRSPNIGSRFLRWLGICCFAVAIEILEWVTYHNRMEWKDVLVDVFGAAIGAAIVTLIPWISAGIRSTEAP